MNPFELARGLLARLAQTQGRLTPHERRRGVNMLVADGMCTMGMTALQGGGPFLAAFAFALGASNYEIGMLASLAFIAQPMQLIGLSLVQRVKARRAIAVVCAVASRLLWLFIILIPALFVDRGAAFLLHCLLVSALVASVPGPAWGSWVKDVVPPTLLGRLMSHRMLLGTALGMGLTLAGGLFIDWWKAAHPAHSLFAYSILFALGMAFGLLGVVWLSRIPEPRMKGDGAVPLMELLAVPLRDRNFRPLLIFMACWNLAVTMATPFFIIYMLKRIELPLSTVTILVVTAQLFTLLFLRVWGRLSDRFSNKSVIGVSGPIYLLGILAWSFTTMPEPHVLTLPLLFLIHACLGMSLAGITLASSNIVLKLSPSGYAHAYATVFGLAGAVTGAIGPLVGGLIADFFVAYELSVSINLSSAAKQLSVYALNFRALDFLFLIAFLIGLYAVGRLAGVKEQGDVEEREVVEELKDEIDGMRRLTFLPVHMLIRGIRGRKTQP